VNFTPLTEVSSARGAPMGRRDVEGDHDASYSLIVHHLPFIDGDYDSGGAYWGAGGGPLWRAVEAVDTNPAVEMFIRAKDRWDALAAVREEYPNCVIVDTPIESWFEDFVEGYETAALWSSTDVIATDDGETEDVQLDDYEAAPETKEKFREDCKEFCNFAAPLLAEAVKRNGYTPERAGHDFWLTRNGHGAGFWDRGELKEGGLGDKLSEAAKTMGECSLYLGDDELVYQG
jgi:hypothetical protein